MEKHTAETVRLPSGLSLVIRRPVPEDAAAMVAYLNAVGGESDNLLFGRDEFPLTVEQEADYVRRAADNPNLYMVLGCVGGAIASIAQISRAGRKRVAHNGEIALSVKKEYWRRGIGRAMMEHLIRHAGECGIRNICLAVKADNAPAVALYEKLGFERAGVHRGYLCIDGNDYDELLMDLRI